MKFGKSLWGMTQPIIVNDRIQMHRISIRAGKKCSKHRHISRWNAFIVLSGTLLIREWKSHGLVDVTELKAGDTTTVPPRSWHQFVAETDVKAIEVYYPAALREDDIERTSG